MPELLIKLTDLIISLQKAGLLLAQKGPVHGRRISAYTPDTRKLEDGGLFIAYRGVQYDAHARVPEFARQYPRCMFIVEERRCYELLDGSQPALLVTSSREAWSYIAALRFGNPQEKLKMVGVTGTNGKTSTVWFFRQILTAQNIACMTLGTLGVYCGDEMLPSSHTTPDPEELFGNLALAVERGIGWAAMEVSSHAIVQRRLGPIRFDAVAFTSFSRDHLDFHSSMDEYFSAKWQLFSHYKKSHAPAWISTTVQKYLPPVPIRARFYGSKATLGKMRGYGYTIVDSQLNKTKLTLESPKKHYPLSLNFGGDFVMDNFTAAFALYDSLVPVSRLAGEAIRPVPGRFEPVIEASRYGFAVIVDYAHTPDALEKTLAKLKTMTNGKLWVVFGCGGDRDRGKRPLMGAIAERLADKVVVTSDNPRTESPSEIIRHILQGMPQKPCTRVVEDRREAIGLACSEAQAGDCILIAGKGHEDYQIIGSTKYPFDDRCVAAEMLALRS